jgi:hypothetical protein
MRSLAICVLALASNTERVFPMDPELPVLPDAHGTVLVADPGALTALEREGFSFERVVSRRAYASLALVLARDLAELDKLNRLGPGSEKPSAPNHPFKLRWLHEGNVRFELVGVVNRLDRAFAYAPAEKACGEVRLIYRLALAPEGRPVTRLPMTVNVMFPVPDNGGCSGAANAWLALPERGNERALALARILRSAGPYAEVETNLQNLHGPALRLGEDDHAEYLLRAFTRKGDHLEPKRLFNTPRTDLSQEERRELLDWIVRHFIEIDRGSFVLPEKFQAERAISVTPRGLARPRNRLYRALFGGDTEATRAFGGLPFARAANIHSPSAFLRYLDETTCPGCHQSLAVAGFHLLGEERDPLSSFNALAVGVSRHFAGELAWREGYVRAAARGEPFESPRSFAERPFVDRGYGAHCGLEWTCDEGLRCRYATDDEVGFCTPKGPNNSGDACENAVVVPVGGPDGDRVEPKPVEKCRATSEAAQESVSCSPNHFGFPSGLCSEACETLGEVRGVTICADIPLAGFETDCFAKREPIEQCLETHVARRRVRACSAKEPCRDDYGCARVAGAPAGMGACVPPYFVFQARVDGPLLDR